MTRRLWWCLAVAMSTGLIGCNSGVPEPASVQVPGTGLRLTIVRIATDPFLSRHNLALTVERAPDCRTDIDLFPDTGHTSRRNLYVTRTGLVYVVGQFDARVIDWKACTITLSEFRHLDREVIFVGSFDEDTEARWGYFPASERPERPFEKR